MNMETLRGMFPILRRSINDHPLVYLDSAASAQKPLLVTDALKEFYEKSYSNVHRGIHTLAEEATEKYEEARAKVTQFIHAGHDEVIFTSGTTESLNLVARSLVPTFDGGEILVAISEHHSNFVPWQQLAQQHGLLLKIIPLTPDFRLDIAALERMITDTTRIIAIAHASNVLGVVHPIERIAAMKRDALLVVDGAQAVPHLRIDVKRLGCDFYAFSGHKMYGPTGIGVLYGKRALLQKMDPVTFGGEMVKDVTVEKTTWNDVPHKFEAGTPKIAEAIGLGYAVDFLLEIGHEAISAHEQDLLAYALERLQAVEGLSIIGPLSAQDRIGAISFTLEGVHPHDIAQVCNDAGVAIRAGHHCAQPLHCALGIDASARASLGVYNTRGDIDRLISALARVREVFP